MKQLGAVGEAAGSQILLTSYSDTVYNLLLAANTEAHVTIPTGATKVLIKANNIMYVRLGNSSVTAAIPNGNITDGTGSVINPIGYIIDTSTLTRISVISPGAAIVSLEFFN